MSHPLETYWHDLDRDSKRAFSLAHRHSLDRGSGRIRTRYLFGALVALDPDVLSPLLAEIPDSALPDPVPVSGKPEIADLDRKQPPLSPCVTHTTNALGRAAAEPEQITPLDLFVDLTRHGGGSTVSTMRSHGITPDRIDQLLNRLDLTPLKRSGADDS